MAIFVCLEKKLNNKPHGPIDPTWSPLPKNQSNYSCVPRSDVYNYIFCSFNDKGWEKFRCYVSNNTEPTSSVFCISINAWSFKGSLTVFHHLTVTLLSFLYAWYHFWDAPLVAPVMGRLALSLFVLCTNTSILLSLIAPPPSQRSFTWTQ